MSASPHVRPHTKSFIDFRRTLAGRDARSGGAIGRADLVRRLQVFMILTLLAGGTLVACTGGSDEPAGSQASARPTGSEPKDDETAASSDSEGEIKATFAAYKEAVLKPDGQAATDVVTSGTLDYYEDMRRLALTGGPQEIGQQSFLNRFIITRARSQIPPAKLQRFNGEDLFAYGIDQEWTSAAATTRQELGAISVSGDTAVAEVAGAGAGGPLAYDFRLEDDEWKLDLTILIESVNGVLKAQAQQSGQSENAYLFTLLESITGRRVTKAVWKKPGS